MFLSNTSAQTLAPTRYLCRLDALSQLPSSEISDLDPVTQQYPFRACADYLQLIDWRDPDDPIRRLIVPAGDELADWGNLDASNEGANTVAPGVQHKYPDTALMLVSRVCGGLCRYCFRKRLFMQGQPKEHVDIAAGVRYIAEHPEITNVLLTGGDPLILSTQRLSDIVSALRAIPHVRIIRIGSKMPAFNPRRITEDLRLQMMLAANSTPEKRIYLMAHFDHPREITSQAIEAIDCFIRAGVICCNQCPLIRGVNDDSEVLSAMYRKLSWIGCPPYYLFQMRPTTGNKPYVVPIVRGWHIYREALRHGSGVARRARFVMSHETGKVEILAVDDDHIYLRYQRARSAELRGKVLICRRNDDACWLDDLKVIQHADDMPALAGFVD